MAGRNKQPLSVIQGKGRSNHLTKEEMAKREEQEEAMRGFTDKIEAPAYLSAAQKKDFNKLAEELIRLKIFSNLDVDSLARYIDSKDQYIKLTKELRKIKPTEKVEIGPDKFATVANGAYTKLMKTKTSLFNECRSAASDLGLTITSRLKLVIPEAPKEKALSKFAKFGGGQK
ncbi:phage terminase small subunit P27 family [Bacillus infantis]|uniref:Phage terminase small subunit P27 family n=1 Tax=Bacillus infantis TaxID=324767 RepID=A0A5D4RJU9_9BACI|nr:phage terminase small subunit P27 family [Bacillus infantis]TYS50094.1 phage terminase small subunit P27 family [Bacillus infantis]